MVRIRGGKESAPLCDCCETLIRPEEQKYVDEVRKKITSDHIQCKDCEASFPVHKTEDYEDHLRLNHADVLLYLQSDVEVHEDRLGVECCKFCT